MAKHSKRRLELLKKVPNYTKNVAKSVVFSSKDIIKDIAPEISEFTESTAKITQNAINETRQYSTNFQNYMKNFQNSQVMGEMKQIKRDMISDIKSGKFYNKDRMDEKMDESFASDNKDMLADLGFDFSDVDGDLDDEAIIKKLREANKKDGNSNEGDSSVTNVTINRNNVIAAGNDSKSAVGIMSQIASSSRLTNKTIADATNYAAQNQNAIFSVQSVTTHKMFSEISDRLTDMTGYLKGLFDYTGTLNNYITSTMSYYDKSMTAFDTIVATQKELRDLTKLVNGLSEEDKPDDNSVVTHTEVFRNGLDLSSYGKKVKANAQQMIDSTGMTSMLGLAGDLAGTAGGQSILQMLGQNPLKFISDGIAKGLIVNPIKNNLVKTNNTFQSFFKGLSLKGQRMGKEKGPLFEILSNLLGVKADTKETIDTKIKDQVMQWNTYANQSVITVIPTLLSKLLSAVTGGPEYVYDYTAGAFKTKQAIQQKFDADKKFIKTSAYSDYRNQASDILDAFGVKPNEKKHFIGKFDKFIDFLNEEEVFFNAKKDTFKDMKNLGLYDMGEEDFNVVKQLIAASKDQGLKLNDLVYNSRDDQNNFIKEANANIHKTGLSSIFNGMKDTTGATGLTKGIFGSILDTKDSYGSSIMDYMRDIKGILLEGIFTYTIKTKKGLNVSTSLDDRLQDHKNRLAKAKAKANVESNSGKDTYGEDYIPTARRSELGNQLGKLSPSTIQETVKKHQNGGQSISNDVHEDPKDIATASNTTINTFKTILGMPSMFMNKGLEMLDSGMKKVLYGDGSTFQTFTIDLKQKIIDAFLGVNTFLNDKILVPLQDKLFGKDGVFTKLDAWAKDTIGKYKNIIKDKLLGNKTDFGGFEGGFLSGLANRGKNLFLSARQYITGQGYRDVVTGELVPERKGSLVDNLKTSFEGVKDRFATKLFGSKDKETGERDKTGILSQVKDQFLTLGNKAKESLFGNLDISGKDIKESMPQILSGAGIGAAASLFSTLFLPLGIGLVPGLLLGGVTGFARSSEKMQKFLFGDGEKNGILGGKDLQDKINKYLPSTGKGMALGGALGILTGNPLLGPMLGASIGFARKSDTVQKFLFGDGDDDSEALIKKATREKMKEVMPKAGAIATGTFLWSNLGFFGSALLPSGIIGASMFGFASAMALQSESVKKFLFGEIDLETGKRDKNGLLGRVGMWFKYNFVEEVKMQIFSVGNSFKNWFTEKIGNKMLDAFKPMFEELKLAGKKVVGFFAGAINKTFEKHVGLPIKGFLEKMIFNPLKKVFGGFFGAIKKAIELPFAAVGKVGVNLAKKHQRMGLEYTKDYFDKKKNRDKKIKEDKERFKTEKEDRRSKLSHLQDVLWKNKFDKKNENVKNALDDFDNKYKNGKWKDIPLKSYKSLTAIETETEKQTSILDKLSQIGTNIKDSISGIYGNIKDQAVDKLNKGKDKLNATVNNTKFKIRNTKDSIKDKMLDAKDSVVDYKDDKTKSFMDAYAKYKQTLKNKIGTNLDNIILATTTPNVATPNGVTMKLAKQGVVRPVNATTNEPVVDERLEEKKNAANEQKQDKLSGNSKKNTSDLRSIKLSTKAIQREISGQLDGVGWNLDAIRKILVKYTNISADGTPIKRGNNKRSIFNRIKNMVMNPVDYALSVVTDIKDKVVGGITGVFKTVGDTIKGGFKTVGSVLKSGVSIIGSALKTLGTVVEEGAKIFGTLITETVKVAGSILTSSVKALGTVVTGAITGISNAASGLLKGLGTLVGGIASATGKVISGLGSLGGKLIKAGGDVISGLVKLGKDITTTVYKGIVGALKGIGKLISSPFKAIKNKVSGTKYKSKGFTYSSVINYADLFTLSKHNPMHVKVVNFNDMPRDNEDRKSPIQPTGKPNLKLVKPNSAAISSKAEKLESTASSDVNSYVTNVSNTKDYNFMQASKNINDIEAGKVVMSKAIAQTAEASKGTFAFLAKQSKKGGLLGKLGTLLMLGLPKILGFFKNLKSGKWLMNIFGKFFGKGSMISKFGGLLMKGITGIATGISTLVKFLMGTKAGKAIKNGASTIGRKLFGKDRLVSKDGKAVRQKGIFRSGIDKIKSKIPGKITTKDTVIQRRSTAQPVEGGTTLSKAFSGLKDKAKSKLFGRNKKGSTATNAVSKIGNITRPTNIASATKKKGKLSKGLGALANVAGSVANDALSSGLSPSSLDLSQVESVIQIQGNAVIQVNGQLLGGGSGSLGLGGNSVGGNGIGSDLASLGVDIVTDKLEDKAGKAISKKLGKKTGSKIAGEVGEEIAENVGKGLGKSAGKKGLISKGIGFLKNGLGKGLGKKAAVMGATTIGAGALANGLGDVAGDVAETAATKATGVTSKVGNVLNVNFGNSAAEKIGSALPGAASKTVSSTAKNSGVIAKISSLVNEICNSKIMTTAFGKYANVLPKVASWVTEKLAKVGAKKLPSVMAKLTARAAGGVASFGIIPAAFITWDGVTGMMGSEVRQMFKLSPDAEISMGMRLAASLAKVVSNNLTFGLIDSGDIANFIYGLVASDDDKRNLQNNQKTFEQQYQQYAAEQEAAGQEAKSFDDWNSDQNKSVAGKIWDGAKSIGGKIGSGVKKVGSAIGSGLQKAGSFVGKGVKGITDFLGITKKDDENKDNKTDDKSNSDNKPSFMQKIASAGGTVLGALGLGGAGAAAGSLISGLKTKQDGTIDTDGQKVDISTIGQNLTTDAGILFSSISDHQQNISDQLVMLDKIRRQSDTLIDKSNASAQLTMSKANDAMKNTAGMYGNLAATAMNSTMGMATMNSSNNMASYSATQGTADATGGTPVGTAPEQVQSQSKGLFSTVKNVASSIMNGVSKFFGFGGNGDESAKAQAPAQPSNVEYVNGMAYFSQYDPKWANVPYNAKGESGKTIQTSGCGPTSAAMVVSSLTGKYVSPVEAVEFAKKGGYKHAGVGTGWNFFAPFGKQYGIGFSQKGVDKNALQNALRSRQPVILSGQGAHPFTRGGHFVVAAGISGDGNSVLINDPVNKERSKAYSIGGLLRDAQQMWIADKALSGNNPAITGGPAGAATADGTAAQPQQSNNPLDILSQIGNTIVDAAGAVTMGKIYEPNLEPQTGPAGMTGTSTGFNGQIGTQGNSKYIEQYSGVFNAAGQKYGVEPQIMEAISMQESQGNPKAGYPNQPAWGMMQIEYTLADEYKKFGMQYEGKPYSLQDRLDPNKAIPFATSRYGSDLKHYNGDYIKALQAYNFSKYSLDMLIKKYPNNWMDKRNIMGSINGQGNPYGDPKYVEHVMRYYKGNVIKNKGGGNGEGTTKGDKNPVFDIIQFPDPTMAKAGKKPKAKNGKPLIMGGNGGANVRTPKSKVIDLAKKQDLIPKKPTSASLNSFVKNNDMSNKINDLLLAKETVETGRGGNDLNAIITILNQIADNTAQTANNTEEIANKEFSINNQFDNHVEHTQNIDNSNGDTNVANVNPFVNAAQSAANNAPTGYEYAKQLAAK